MIPLNPDDPIPDPARPISRCGCDADVVRRRPAAGLLGLLPGFVLAVAPKCPFCWAAYMSALGSMGISVQIPYQPWLLPLMAGLLLVNLVALFSRAKARGRYCAFFLCLAGGAAIALGKFVAESNALVAVGFLAILAGSLWSASFKRREVQVAQAER